MRTIQIKREGNRWYPVFSCEDVPPRSLPGTGVVTGVVIGVVIDVDVDVDVGVGVGVGVVDFIATSDGEHIANPRWAGKGRARLEAAQQVVARKQRGSGNRRAVRETVAARHRTVAMRRRGLLPEDRL